MPYLKVDAHDVTRPVLIPESKVNPVYPEEARKNGIQGTVFLQLLIEKDGTVEAYEVLYNSQPEDTLHGFSAGVAWTWCDRLEVAAAYSDLDGVFSRASLSVGYVF